MRRFQLVVGVLVLLLSIDAQVGAGQSTGTVAGRIVTEAGLPLGGAQVSISGTSLGGVTSNAGRYLILNVPTGTQTISVQMLGFGTIDAQVTVTAGETVVQNFQLGEEAIAIDAVTVTVGSRAAHTTADEMAVPVDVFPEAQIVETGQVEMAAVLNELSPSIYFPRRQISDLTSGVRPFQLRGLAPDHALVLVNGKRRHPTAVVNVFGGGAFPGGSGVDMNAIPTMAIGRMEVLRDGAAAQYGSDAIAGVINVGLKNTASPLAVSLSLGQYFPEEWPNDGQRWDLSANYGFNIGRAVLNVTGSWSQRDPTNRAGADNRDQLVDGDADIVENGKVVQKNNAVRQPNHLWGDGESTNRMVFWNFELPTSEDSDASTFYVFGGLSSRTDIHSGYFRRSKDGRNWPSIHPLGFLPTFDADTRDASVVTGLRGVASGWSYDVSAQLGQNRLDTDIKNTLNVSLGPCLDTPCAPGRDGILGTADDPGLVNKTRFYAGSLQMTQMLANIDASKQFDVGLPSPLTVAFGAGFRNDNYQVVPGEPGSYENGYHPNQNGGIAASGSQVFPGYRADQATDADRQNVGVYAEAEANLHERVLMSGAARFENYSDFGSTVTGKLALRLEASENLVFRTAVATGFRAPALSQIHYGHVSTGFRADPNDSTNQVAFEIGEFPVGSAEARAVGAEDLVEEKSKSFSAGFAVTPTANWNITLDGYIIDVDDAIVMSNTLSGDFIEDLLRDFAAESIRFFSNAIDFRAKGIDLTTNYRYYFGNERLLETVFSANWGKNEARSGVKANPVLAGEANNIYDEFDITNLEEGRPAWRGIFKVSYTHSALKATIGANYFDSRLSRVTVDPDVFEELDAGATWDAEVSYEARDGLRISFGGENILDKFPTRSDNFRGIFPYSSSSPWGFNGRYFYTRISARGLGF